MKKIIYHKLFTRLIYTWLSVFILLLLIIIQLNWLGTFLNQEQALHKQQIKLIDFTYRTELISNRLTDNIKIFSYTFNPEALGIYLQELKKVKKADDYILFLKHLQSSPSEVNFVLKAKALADSIREIELKSIKLMLFAYNVSDEMIPTEIKSFQLSPEEDSLSKQEKINLAIKLLQAPEYLESKQEILKLIKQMRQAILLRTSENIIKKISQIDYLFMSLMISAILCLIIILWIIWFRRLSLKKWLS